MPLHTAILALKRAYYGDRGEPFRIAGQTLRFDPGTRPTRLRYATSPNAVNRYDALQTMLLAERLRPGDFAVDVGGASGGVALVMAACCGSTGSVVTFEPDPAAREKMAQNFELNPHVKRPTVEPMAVSDRGGEAELFSDGGRSNSSLRSDATGAEVLEALKVETVSLDDYLGDRQPAWVKFDIEGAEIAALRGASRLLDGPANVLVELHPYAWGAFGDSFEELCGLVSATGRRIRYLDQAHKLTGEPVYGIALLERAR